MKAHYDNNAKSYNFRTAGGGACFSPSARKPLVENFRGPYVVKKKVGDLGYLFVTRDRRKEVQLCHINMSKPYYCLAEPSVGSGALAIPGGGERENGSVSVAESRQWW